MRISAHFVPSQASLFLGAMKTAFGRKATNLPLSSIRILSVSSQAWRSRLVVLFVRVIVKTHSVRASFFLTRLLLFASLAAIPKPLLMNIGSLNGCSMDFGTARGIGMIKLMPSSAQSGSPYCLKTSVSIQDLYMTPRILHTSSNWPRCPSVSMLTTLSISPKIL